MRALWPFRLLRPALSGLLLDRRNGRVRPVSLYGTYRACTLGSAPEGQGIENSVWVIAPAQVGRHADGRTTHGHSVVIDPWGKVELDLGGERPSQATVDIEFETVARARSQIPTLPNGRTYSFRHIERPREAIEDAAGSSSR